MYSNKGKIILFSRNLTINASNDEDEDDRVTEDEDDSDHSLDMPLLTPKVC